MSRGFWNIFCEGGEGLCPLDHMQEVYLDIFHMAVIIISDKAGIIFAVFQPSKDFRLDVVVVYDIAIAYIPYGFRHEVNAEVEVVGYSGVVIIGAFYGVNKAVSAGGFHCDYLLSVSVPIFYHLFRKLQYLFSLSIIYNFGRKIIYYILLQMPIKNLIYYI